MARVTRKGKEGQSAGWSSADIEGLLRRYHRLGKAQNEQKSPDHRLRAKASVPASTSQFTAIHLRECRRFARAYTDDELEALLKLRTVRGTPLPWGVVRQLMGIHDKAKRQTLQERAAREGWSSIKAAEFIQLQVFRAKRSMGGRPFAAPRNLAELIQQIERHHEQSLRRYTVWISFLKEREQKAILGKSTQRLLRRIEAARATLKTIASRANELAKQLETLETDGL
jgi:hypothetical protein